MSWHAHATAATMLTPIRSLSSSACSSLVDMVRPPRDLLASYVDISSARSLGSPA